MRFLCAFRRSCKPPSAGLFPLTRTPKCLRMRGTDERSVKSGGHLVQSLIRPLELAAPPLKRGGGEPRLSNRIQIRPLFACKSDPF